MIEIIRGYSGYYKGVYLRSSYEYAYAVYLDHNNIIWRYEEKIFDLGECKYKPDFFIYDTDFRLKYIIEVKSGQKDQVSEAVKKINLMKQIYNIDCYLITRTELLDLYNRLPFSFTSKVNEWINSENTTIHSNMNGELNPHFGMKHNEETRTKIGMMTTLRWQDDKMRYKMMIGSKEGAQKVRKLKKGIFKKKRETRNCLMCDKIFTVIETSKQIFCSQTCGSKYNFHLATEVNVQNKQERYKDIKEFAIKWVKDNKEIINDANFSKINTALDPLINEIHNKFNIKDIRIISLAVTGDEQAGRRNLLSFLKDLISSDLNSSSTNEDLRNCVLNWCIENKEYINSLEFKKVQESLKPLADIIYDKFNLRDGRMRPIQDAILGSRKGMTELLRYLKNYVNN